MSTYVVGFVGRLSLEKDPDAAYRLAVAAPGVTVVVVGDGPLLAAMRMGGPSNLKVMGPDHDHGSVIAACDAILVPSQFESFGLTIAEALWLGVPVISTAAGLAAIKPSLTRTIPISATGAQLAAAVAADRADPIGTTKRVTDGQAWAKANLGMDRFGRQWAVVLAAMSPPTISVKITAIVNGNVKLAALSPRLDLTARVDTCPFSDGSCGCNGVARPCHHPGRPDRVERPYCLRCQEGEFDSDAE